MSLPISSTIVNLPKRPEMPGCVISTVSTAALVQKHQATSIHNQSGTKPRFGSQNFGYQFWCLLCNICNVFKNVFNVDFIVILQSIVVEGFATTEI